MYVCLISLLQWNVAQYTDACGCYNCRNPLQKIFKTAKLVIFEKQCMSSENYMQPLLFIPQTTILTQFNFRIVSQQNVLAFNVSVNNSVSMQIGQAT